MTPARVVVALRWILRRRDPRSILSRTRVEATSPESDGGCNYLLRDRTFRMPRGAAARAIVRRLGHVRRGRRYTGDTVLGPEAGHEKAACHVERAVPSVCGVVDYETTL